jgi:hypothetical protein
MIKCADCKFWDRRDRSQAGFCRVHSAVLRPDSGAMGHWPVTESTEWCGEGALQVEGVGSAPVAPSGAVDDAVLGEREACAKLLDARASELREKASAGKLSIGKIKQLDMAAGIMDDAADIIRRRSE